MCGFAGVLSGQPRHDLIRDAEIMSGVLRHRGPDDSGSWGDETGHCALGFRRLAIQDLSPNGHQPMSSPSGRFTLVFNGEIYNHAAIRDELTKLGYRFRGHSDTETLCAGMEVWGVVGTITRCIGMFAIAAWDKQSRTLSLVRDRLGIKPLYFSRANGLVLFGSELKALRAHPEFRAQLNIDAVESFLRYLYIPGPTTIYQNTHKVQPGHVVTFGEKAEACRSEPYWSLTDVYAAARKNPFEGSESEGINALEELLFDAVSIRKLSDVPLGALLSGGIDSTTVVALMQAGSQIPTRTFSIGFTTREHDESVYAARIAQHLGTAHTAEVIDGADSLAVIPELPFMFDEPFADPSQIPTFLVSRMARKDVTVALTGDGGDELFGGYHRYIEGHRIIPRAAQLPRSARRVAAAALHGISDWGYPVVAPVMKLTGQRLAQQKLRKLGVLLGRTSTAAMYQSLLSAWQDPSAVLTRQTGNGDQIEALLRSTETMPLLDRMMLVDQATYLPDELLAKVDRASMAVSLEARVPIIDHRVVELSWRFPQHWKIRNGRGKWILRQVLNRHVPQELVDRPKVGFSVPIDEWLRGPLKSWGAANINTAGDPLNRSGLQKVWKRFQAGEPGLGLSLWAAIMFGAWRTAWEQ